VLSGAEVLRTALVSGDPTVLLGGAATGRSAASVPVALAGRPQLLQTPSSASTPS
jgi:hypothetical protein